MSETQARVDADALAAENEALKEYVLRLEGALRKLPFGVVVAEAPSGRVLLTSGRADDLVSGAERHPQSLADYDRFEAFRPDGSRL